MELLLQCLHLNPCLQKTHLDLSVVILYRQNKHQCHPCNKLKQDNQKSNLQDTALDSVFHQIQPLPATVKVDNLMEIPRCSANSLAANGKVLVTNFREAPKPSQLNLPKIIWLPTEIDKDKAKPNTNNNKDQSNKLVTSNANLNLNQLHFQEKQLSLLHQDL